MRSAPLSFTPFLIGAFFISLLAACNQQEEAQTPTTPPESESAAEALAPTPAPTPPSEPDYPTRAYFGDTHVHTGWSADAGLDGAITTPEDAFRLASGEEVMSNTGRPVKLSRPFDWMVITDHSDGMGVINEIIAGNEEMLASPVVKGWYEALNSGDEQRMSDAKQEVIELQSNGKLPSQIMDPKWMDSAWTKTIAAAEKYNNPGTFTAFIGYEWTVNADGGNNLHRNVIYRDGADRAGTRLPLTTFQTQDPEDLWAWMAKYEQETGGKLLAIPHNGNLSNGRMFEEMRFDGSPLTQAYAEERQRWEPLFETTQMKGQSEVHPSLSPNDEFANYDLWDTGNLIGVPKKPGMYRTEYWREALKAGMRIEQSLGANPFKYGANGGTDTHTGLPTSDEDNFWGKFKTVEPSAERWMIAILKGPTDATTKRGIDMSASGKMGVWATANTREALWDAMMRRETFSTTGTRMTVRFFGGYDFTESDAGSNMVAAGYARGVPMGGDLAADGQGRPPTFLIAAMKDPDGANLDRVQVIKGWVDADGGTHEKIYDVAWSGDRQPGPDGKLPPVGNTVDLSGPSYENSIGAPQLMGLFKDPDFDPSLRAFYYVRVLEIPTPKWTAFDVVRYGAQMPEGTEMTIQERALSSPIWYKPGR